MGKAIRSIFKIIKAHNHFDNLRIEGQNPVPQQLRRITDPLDFDLAAAQFKGETL